MSNSKYNRSGQTQGPFSSWVEEFFNHDLENLFGGHSIGRNPAVNVIEQKDAFLLEVSAAGYDKKILISK